MAADLIVEGNADAPAAEAAPKNKKKLMIIGGAVAALLLTGGVGGFMMMGGDAQAEGGHEAASAAKAESHGDGETADGASPFVDMPPMVVNLRSPDGSARFLKIHLMLVPGKASQDELKAKLPLMQDAYQPFLRELRPEDLAGSAAVFRIKEELMVRTADAIGADKVSDILIQDLVQQ